MVNSESFRSASRWIIICKIYQKGASGIFLKKISGALFCYWLVEKLPFLLDFEDKSENGRECLGTSDDDDLHKYYLRMV